MGNRTLEGLHTNLCLSRGCDGCLGKVSPSLDMTVVNREIMK